MGPPERKWSGMRVKRGEGRRAHSEHRCLGRPAEARGLAALGGDRMGVFTFCPLPIPDLTLDTEDKRLRGAVACPEAAGTGCGIKAH